MNRMSLSDLPLRPSTLQLLKKRGFSTVQELTTAKAGGGGMSNLAAELTVTVQQAAELWREVQRAYQCVTTTTTNNNNNENSSNHAQPSGQTATALLQQHADTNNSSNNSNSSSCTNKAIITFSRDVDQLLDGGVALGELTEIAGVPGAGKTQWGMQLAVNAALPTVYGGVQGETIYVDTEGSFSPERCHQMSLALVNHIHTGRRKQQATAAVTTHHQQQQQSSPDLPATFTPDGILQGIHVYRVHDPAAQTAVVHALPVLLHQRAAAGSPVRLIVVDSVAFHHRTGATEGDEAQYYLRRTRLLTQQAAFLARTAVDFGLAVVAINQMTTQFSSRANHNGGSRSSSSISGSGAVATQTCLVPALGESWAHAVTTRLLLTCSTGGGGGNAEEEQRTCHLVKSPRLPSGQAVYSVTAQGVRGATSSSSSNSNTKRQRTS